jgi:hypothetical protein
MVGQTFSESIEVFKKYPGPWIVIGLVVMVLGSVIPVLGGLLLLPGVVREGSASIAEDRAPDVGALFSRIGDDIGPMIIYTLAHTIIGIVTCGLGSIVVWILFWYTIEFAADGRVAAPDALKASVQWTKNNLADTIMMALASSAIATLATTFTCGLGVVVATPFVFIMWSVHWMRLRDDAHAMVAQSGIEVLPA